MHRRPEAELLPLDTKLERTLRNLKKVRIAEAVTMEEQEGTDQYVPRFEKSKISVDISSIFRVSANVDTIFPSDCRS